MAYGLVSYNDSGVVQIDETFKCMQLLKKVTLTNFLAPSASYDNILAAYFQVSKSISPGLPLIASYIPPLSSSQIAAGVERMIGSISDIQQDASNWFVTYVLIGEQAFRSDPTPSIDVYIFGEPRVDSGFGMNIYNSSSQIVFSSKAALLQIKAMLSGTADDSASIPSGKKYAVLHTLPQPPFDFSGWDPGPVTVVV